MSTKGMIRQRKTSILIYEAGVELSLMHTGSRALVLR